MSFINADGVLAGIKRGAEKFGTAVAKKTSALMGRRLNGHTYKDQEPYGLGMGGGEGAAPPSQAADPSGTEQESQEPLDQIMKNADANNMVMVSKCPACGHESPHEWSGKCESCGAKALKDVGGLAIGGFEAPERNAEMASTQPEAREDLAAPVKQAVLDVTESRVNEADNAGHLEVEAWTPLSTEEKAAWLQEADQDVNLSRLPFEQLSEDVKVALSGVKDRGQLGALTNASGVMPWFVFKDDNGEEAKIQAKDEADAWQKLSDNFATPVGDLKRMVKLVKTIKNANPDGDLQEIERHVDGIKHEVDEMKVENGKGDVNVECLECRKMIRMLRAPVSDAQIAEAQEEHKIKVHPGEKETKMGMFRAMELNNESDSLSGAGLKRGKSKYGVA